MSGVYLNEEQLQALRDEILTRGDVRDLVLDQRPGSVLARSGDVAWFVRSDGQVDRFRPTRQERAAS